MSRFNPSSPPLRLVGLCLALLVPVAARAQTQYGANVASTPHNLSIQGPGVYHAASEQQICIFCHTPHHASKAQPLWNRHLPPAGSYKPYTSAAITAGQPSGSSKLCLSCHDGTIALGAVLTRDQPIVMAGNKTNLPPGATNLGTDLSDDHPISFTYDRTLVSNHPDLRDPMTLTGAVKLDKSGQVQCTTCHDPHNDAIRPFLVMSNTNSALCLTCHSRTQNTNIEGHSGCADCHQQHTAPSGALLLRGATVTETCNLSGCHAPAGAPMAAAPLASVQRQSRTTPPAAAVSLSNPAAQSPSPRARGAEISGDLRKASRHDTNPPVGMGKRAINQVTCTDCHGQHSMKSQVTASPLTPGMLGRVSGIDVTGAPVRQAVFEYQVCLRCHSERNPIKPAVTRQITQINMRLKMAPDAVSFHPVTAPGRNTDVPSLRQQFTTASQIACTDCHGSDTSRKAGGSGANGPHGSNIKPLLLAPYSMRDQTPESATAYSLCYRCHDRNSILTDQSFKRHKLHVIDQRTPCSVCHDPHGIASGQGSPVRNAHLINFDTTIVRPDPITKRLEYQSRGSRSGACFLSCHGRVHSGLSYQPTSAPSPTSRRPNSRR